MRRLNVGRNVLGLGLLLCTSVGLTCMPFVDRTNVWSGVVIGLATSGLYLAGLAVGKREPR